MTLVQFLTVSVTAGTLTLLPALAVAQTPETNGAGMLTAEEASSIALQVQPGTIGEAELDEFDGKPAYDIEVVTAAGEEIEFKIDVATGEILNMWTDDDPTNDPVSGAAEEPSN